MPQAQLQLTDAERHAAARFTRGIKTRDPTAALGTGACWALYKWYATGALGPDAVLSAITMGLVTYLVRRLSAFASWTPDTLDKRPHVVEWSDSHIAFTSGAATSRFAWTDFERWEDAGGLLMLYPERSIAHTTTQTNYFVLPHRIFADMAASAEIRARLAAVGVRHAGR